MTYCLQRKVEDWKKSDVYKWLAVLQMSKYEESFKTVSGKASYMLAVLFAYFEVGFAECDAADAEGAAAVCSRCVQIC